MTERFIPNLPTMKETADMADYKIDLDRMLVYYGNYGIAPGSDDRWYVTADIGSATGMWAWRFPSEAAARQWAVYDHDNTEDLRRQGSAVAVDGDFGRARAKRNMEYFKRLGGELHRDQFVAANSIRRQREAAFAKASTKH